MDEYRRQAQTRHRRFLSEREKEDGKVGSSHSPSVDKLRREIGENTVSLKGNGEPMQSKSPGEKFGGPSYESTGAAPDDRYTGNDVQKESQSQKSEEQQLVELGRRYAGEGGQIQLSLLIPRKGTRRLRIGKQALVSEIQDAFKPRFVNLILRGQRLGGDDTLEDAGVHDGDIIHCWPASAPPRSGEQAHQQQQDHQHSSVHLAKNLFFAFALAFLGIFWGLLFTTGRKFFDVSSLVLLVGLTVATISCMQQLYS